LVTFSCFATFKNAEAKLFYAKSVSAQTIGVRELRKKIAKKEFERTAIANLQNTSSHSGIHDNFKDPYFLDFLGLQDTYLERDLEEAILRELETFRGIRVNTNLQLIHQTNNYCNIFKTILFIRTPVNI